MDLGLSMKVALVTGATADTGRELPLAAVAGLRSLIVKSICANALFLCRVYRGA